MQATLPPTNRPPPPPDPQALAALRAHLGADPDRLDALAEQDAGTAHKALLALAAELGHRLDPVALRTALAADTLGLERFAVFPVTGTRRPGPRWLPVALGSDGAQVTVEWAHFGTAPLDQPFFEEALRRARAHPVSRLFAWRTPIMGLLDEPELQAPLRIDGLVLHMSRCGSTLVKHALAVLPGSIALSEPAPLDAVLQLCAQRNDLDFDLKVALVRAMAGALLSDRTGTARRRFIKTDCWHVTSLPLLRAAFPEVPWIFLYRDPVEVLASHERMLGAQTMPGAEAALVGVIDPLALPGIEFAARVLAAVCASIAEQFPVTAGGLLVDYASLPAALFNRILPHFGIVPDDQEIAAIGRVLGRNAKSPSQQFEPPGQPVRSTASEQVRAASARHLAPVVERLRALDRQAAD